MRPYRWVMYAYPPTYRREHEPELVDTALEMNDGTWSARQALSFLFAGFLLSLRMPRRWWGIAVATPVAYGGTQVLYLWAREREDLLRYHDALEMAIWLTKLATVPALLLLIILLAERFAERPSRWRQATTTWAIIGVATVALGTIAGSRIGRLTSDVTYARIWPGGTSEVALRRYQELEGLSGSGTSWTVANVLSRELLAVVLIALVAGVALRLCSTWSPKGTAVVVPAVVLASLFLYGIAAPWSFIADYDFFVGDAVLGSVRFELLFFFVPADPLGGVALGVAALSMGGLLLAWGGAVPAPIRQPAPALRNTTDVAEQHWA